MKYKKELYNKLESKKIEINWNKNPIKMSDFLSFLTIELERSASHLGDINGWTKLFNKDSKLLVRGGVVKGIEYLDSIEYGDKLSNPYNNYVNPFFLFDIMNNEGKAFFINYYKEDIDKILTSQERKVDICKANLKDASETYDGLKLEVESLFKSLNQPPDIPKEVADFASLAALHDSAPKKFEDLSKKRPE